MPQALPGVSELSSERPGWGRSELGVLAREIRKRIRARDLMGRSIAAEAYGLGGCTFCGKDMVPEAIAVAADRTFLAVRRDIAAALRPAAGDPGPG